MSEPVATWRETVTGPRWAGFGRAIRDRIWLDPRLTILAYEEDRSLLRTTTRFEVQGPRSSVEALKQDVMTGVREYNHA